MIDSEADVAGLDLFDMLVGLTSGEAFTIVRGTEGTKGFLVWKRLRERFNRRKPIANGSGDGRGRGQRARARARRRAHPRAVLCLGRPDRQRVLAAAQRHLRRLPCGPRLPGGPRLPC